MQASITSRCTPLASSRSAFAGAARLGASLIHVAASQAAPHGIRGRSLPLRALDARAEASKGGVDSGGFVDRRTVLAAAPALAAAALAGDARAGGVIVAPADVAAPPADALVTASGLASKVLKAGDGSGARPFAYDKVTCDYTGWTTDGKMFDSSVTRGKPSTFPLSAVIKGWTEGLQLMETGETRRFWIPENLAYQGRGGGRPAGMLVFDVTIFSIERGTPPPPAPADVAAAPADAEVTATGLQSKVITASTVPGAKRPGPKSQVTVDYSGWTTDGNLFDSSVVRKKRATFKADYVIKGWTEGLQLMQEGESRRFWIPPQLAYGSCDTNTNGRPCGTLVFDVTLYSTDAK